MPVLVHYTIDNIEWVSFRVEIYGVLAVITVVASAEALEDKS